MRGQWSNSYSSPSRSVNMVRHPRGSYIVIPVAVSRVATPENKVQLIGAVIHEQESRHKVPKCVLQAPLGRMQFTLHATRRTPHGASRFAQAMSAWLVKTRRAPVRQSRDARVYVWSYDYGHEQTEYPSPRPPRLRMDLWGYQKHPKNCRNRYRKHLCTRGNGE